MHCECDCQGGKRVEEGEKQWSLEAKSRPLISPECWKGKGNIFQCHQWQKKIQKTLLDMNILLHEKLLLNRETSEPKVGSSTAQFIKQEWVSTFLFSVICYWKLTFLSYPAWAYWFVADDLGSSKVTLTCRRLKLCFRSESAFQGNQYNLTFWLCDWECLV